MDMDFNVGPLLGTFHFRLKKPFRPGGGEYCPRKVSNFKSISLEDLTIVLNFCSHFNH